MQHLLHFVCYFSTKPASVLFTATGNFCIIMSTNTVTQESVLHPHVQHRAKSKRTESMLYPYRQPEFLCPQTVLKSYRMYFPVFCNNAPFVRQCTALSAPMLPHLLFVVTVRFQKIAVRHLRRQISPFCAFHAHVARLTVASAKVVHTNNQPSNPPSLSIRIIFRTRRILTASSTLLRLVSLSNGLSAYKKSLRLSFSFIFPK